MNDNTSVMSLRVWQFEPSLTRRGEPSSFNFKFENTSCPILDVVEWVQGPASRVGSPSQLLLPSVFHLYSVALYPALRKVVVYAVVKKEVTA